MKVVAGYFDTGVSFSLMDLSVEAEAFGSPVHYSADDVLTVHAVLVHDEDGADAMRVPKIWDGRTGECVKGIEKACELIKVRPVLAGIIGLYSLAGRIAGLGEVFCVRNYNLCFIDGKGRT